MSQWRFNASPAPSAPVDYLALDAFDAAKRLPNGYQQVWRDTLSKAIIAVRGTGGER
jgi:hypothetical protein